MMAIGDQRRRYGIELAVIFAMKDEDDLKDSVLVIRCRYCVAGQEFMPMLAYKDGRYVCAQCAHTQRPGDPNYQCQCRSCIRTRRLAEQIISELNSPHG